MTTLRTCQSLPGTTLKITEMQQPPPVNRINNSVNINSNNDSNNSLVNSKSSANYSNDNSQDLNFESEDVVVVAVGHK
jgi:hypothetical protein